MANWVPEWCCRHLPALPLHARHPQVLPAGVQQVHLFPDLRVLLLAQVPLRQQGGAGTEDAAHTALVGGQLHHVALARDGTEVVSLLRSYCVLLLLLPEDSGRKGCLFVISDSYNANCARETID